MDGGVPGLHGQAVPGPSTSVYHKEPVHVITRRLHFLVMGASVIQQRSGFAVSSAIKTLQ